MKALYHRSKKRWNQADRNMKLFIIGIMLVGINGGILSSTMNNFFADIYHLTAEGRGNIEGPREFPGFILIFITGLLAAVPVKYWAVAVGLLSSLGLIGLGFQPEPVWLMAGFMIIWSMGEHLFMPVESTVGLILAKEGMQGKKLGQISGYRNLAMIGGAVIVWLAGEFLLNNNHILNVSQYYTWLYFIAGLVAFLSIFAFSRMNFGKHELENSHRFVIRKEYGYFYWLNILFGARKQLFLTFAPWVLVTVFKTGPEKIALLIMIASILGVIFRQAFGILTDKFGEVKMFIADAIVLLCICLGFAYSQNIWFLYILYILDNLMFASRIARTTYLNKVAVDKKDIPATLSFGLSIDHLVSMTIPFLGGLLWKFYGYPAVFLTASILSVCGFVTALLIGRSLNLKAQEA